MSLVLRLRSIGVPDTAADASHILEKRDLVAPSGGHYHLFMPVSPAGITVIAVHGVTLDGNNDFRVIQFARALAGSGVACVLPNLYHIANGSFNTEDLDLLGELIGMYGQSETNRLGLIGFSYAGSYVLTAAAREELAAKVSFVITFGACYSIAESFQVSESFKPLPETDLEWDKYIHFALMGIHRFYREMGIPSQIAAECDDLLRDYCSHYSNDFKRQFYQSKLASYEPLEFYRTRVMEDSLDQLSPKGKLAGIKCRVSLIHGIDDHMIPPQESRKILAELNMSPCPVGSGLLVTGLLGHVHPGQIGLFELLRFVRSLRLIFDLP